MRKAVRVNLGLFVYDATEKNVIGFMYDLSIKGCFVETERKFDLNSSINIEFELPDFITKIKTEGVVVRSENRGVGIMFDLDKKQKKIVGEFVKYFE